MELSYFWRTWVLFCGATDTTVLDFWWHLPWVDQSQGGVTCMLSCLHTIPQDSPSVAASCVPHMHFSAEIGCWGLNRWLPTQQANALFTRPPRLAGLWNLASDVQPVSWFSTQPSSKLNTYHLSRLSFPAILQETKSVKTGSTILVLRLLNVVFSPKKFSWWIPKVKMICRLFASIGHEPRTHNGSDVTN